ncbi:hypothetical protein [Pajaroellobacter abortibovis]|uniref:Uncharacterized protein n=1 Tax=Pajaroellobacter abortibovis TaxID=1882918 RepID=A0A1L6MWE7_9BACT|nr:hypothetical protein [Pajaroellobacter abortibovis]APR99862.1 hypothetical protein BCY86_03600 [Pajaroellobacter abortibovis]
MSSPLQQYGDAWKELHSLSLHVEQFDDSIMDKGNAQSLQSFKLERNYTDQTLEHAYCWPLKSLTLIGDRFTNDGLAHVYGLSNIQSLHLDGNAFTGQDVIENGDKWIQLKSLELLGSGFNDSAIKHASFWNLQSIKLSQSKYFTDKVITETHRWKGLTSLVLHGDGFTGDIIQAYNHRLTRIPHAQWETMQHRRSYQARK